MSNRPVWLALCVRAVPAVAAQAAGSATSRWPTSGPGRRCAAEDGR
jgi:hypothetical protein